MSDEPKKFEGFPDLTGNFTQVPNIAFTIMHELTGAEYKCLLYIIRHTYGFHEAIKAITLDEFQDGRKRSDGTRMDNGTGLSKQSVIASLQSLLEKGYLIVETDDRDKARKERAYGVNRMSKNLTSEVKKLDIGGLKSVHRTEKQTLDINLSNTVAPDGATLPDEYDAFKTMLETPVTPKHIRPNGLKPHPNNPHILAMLADMDEDAANAEPTDFDLLVKAVELTLIKGEGAVVFAKMLSGMKGRGEYNQYRMDEPVTATELQDWAIWYERTNPRLNKPTAPMKLQSSILEWRQAGVQKSTGVQNRTTADDVTAPAPVSADDRAAILNLMNARKGGNRV